MRKMFHAKHILAVAAVTATAFASSALAQEELAPVDEAVEKILNKAVEAMGGEENFEKIESSKVVMVSASQFGDQSMTLFWKKPNMTYMEMEIPNMGKMTSGSNGTVGWSHNTAAGYMLMDPATMNNPGFSDPIGQLRSSYSPLEFAGEEEFKGKQCDKLRGVTKSPMGEQEAFIYFDQETGLMAGMTTSFEMQGQTMESTTTFEEYKEVDGILVAMKMASEQMGMASTMTIKEIEFNTVEDSRFELPDEVKKMAAEAEEGKDG